MTRRIGIIGFGNQGKAWALNLKDQGWEVCVFLRPKSTSRQPALALGLEVKTLGADLRNQDVLAALIPDDAMAELVKEVFPFFKRGQTWVFAHGFTLHYQTAPWPQGINRVLVSPKGIGSAVRQNFLQGGGVPALIAVENEVTQDAWAIANSVADGIGAGRVGKYKVTVKEEVEVNLFAEQSILCGGLPFLIAGTYETLVRNGYPPAAAYLECLHEVAFMANILQKEGLYGLLARVSPTARFGGFRGGQRLISETFRQDLKAMLLEIQSGTFAAELAQEASTDYATTRRSMSDLFDSSVEQTGRDIRKHFETNLFGDHHG